MRIAIRLPVAASVLILASLSACASVSSESRGPGNRKLERYETADPIADCRAAIAQRDFCFLAVGGMADTIPGFPHFKSRYLRGASRPHGYTYRVINGTSEFITGTEDLRLQGVAARYAERYNRYLFRHLRSHNEA
jgi:hypothetical protein